MKRGFSIIAAVAVLGAWLVAAEAAGPLTLEASISLGSRAHDLVLDLGRPDGDFAHVATDLGLTVVDISDPTAPAARGSVSLGGKSFGITRQGSLVFVANQTTGLRVVDVTNPDAPVVVATKAIPYKAWDVAVKEDVVYVVSYAGEMYVFRYARPSPPAVTLTQIKVIGLQAWSSAAHDAGQLAKMNKIPTVTSGNAKVTGVSVTGDTLLTVDFAYGRIFYYDVTDADNPTFPARTTRPSRCASRVIPRRPWPTDSPPQAAAQASTASPSPSSIRRSRRASTRAPSAATSSLRSPTTAGSPSRPTASTSCISLGSRA